MMKFNIIMKIPFLLLHTKIICIIIFEYDNKLDKLYKFNKLTIMKQSSVRLRVPFTNSEVSIDEDKKTCQHPKKYKEI